MTERVRPFRIDISEETLSRISKRVADYRFFPAPADDGWQYGTSTAVLKEFVAHWQSGYDWRREEANLNRWPHYKTEIDGLDVHFVHVVGEAGGKRPLLITHGWPGSFFEFWKVIERLAFPGRHGGNNADAFDLVIPSLPGYGFSGKPHKPFGQRATAALFDTLMRERLGYDRYLAQGGDWGGLVTSWLGFDHGAEAAGAGCCAIHLNMIGFRPTPATPQTPGETAWLKRTQSAMQQEGAYFSQQATKPQTLALALMDSPVGQLAWILEKFHGWSDLKDGDLGSRFTKDELLTNVMIYLVSESFATSVWYYNALFIEGGMSLPDAQRCETPTGFANFPGEKLYAPPPRSWCDRAYNIVHWTDMPEGGHFAAMEQPQLFTDDVRAWARLFD